MKRLAVSLDDIACWDNLNLALWKAARGKRSRPDVARFLGRTEYNLCLLQHQLQCGKLDFQQFRRFIIRDPKPRDIVAVGFALRVVHHAIMNLIGSNLERSQIPTSYACLPGRGVHAAVQRVQRGLRQAQFYVMIDIAKYFENIDHRLLKAKLACRFKGKPFLGLLGDIIDSYSVRPGVGLPIGSLMSQYFANFFLEKVDRHILDMPETRGYVRYMDDMIWFCPDRCSARHSLHRVRERIEIDGLTVKVAPQIQATGRGVGYCGYRIFKDRILLSRRKMKSYAINVKRWQERYSNGEISPLELQQGVAAVHGSTLPASSLGFRRKVLGRMGDIEV